MKLEFGISGRFLGVLILLMLLVPTISVLADKWADPNSPEYWSEGAYVPLGEWLNEFVWDIDYGNGTHILTSHVGPQVFWDNGTNNWDELKFEDHYSNEGYYLMENSHITVHVYDWYSVFYDPNNQRVCVDDERWIVEYWWNDKQWREVDLYNPSLSYSNNGTHLKVSRMFDSDDGYLRVSYILWQGSPLKHEVVFKSKMADENVFRVVMKLSGIYTDKVRYKDGFEIVTGSKSLISPYFLFGEDNHSLVLSEYLWDLGHINENRKWESDTLKEVVLDAHAKGSKADVIIGNYTLAQNESLSIDPETSTHQEDVSELYWRGKRHTILAEKEAIIRETGGVPNLVLGRWDGECNIDLGFSLTHGVPTRKINGRKIIYETDEGSFIYYPTGGWKETLDINGTTYDFPQGEFGGFRFEIVLEQAPETDKFVFPIQTENLMFYYQPPLHLDHPTWVDKSGDGIADNFCPENVVGSYAVYHTARTNMHTSAENAEKYKTGKAFHIYRPKLTDADGKEVWVSLDIDEEKGVLNYTLSQEFLDVATYPVTIGGGSEIFGYDTIGTYVYAGGTDYIVGSWDTPAGAGIAKNITFYLALGSRDDGPRKLGLYRTSDNVFVNGTAEYSGEAGDNWITHPLETPTSITVQGYWIVHWGAEVAMRYDTGASGIGGSQEIGYPAAWPSPWNPTLDTNLFSIYCTYEPTGVTVTQTFLSTTTVDETVCIWTVIQVIIDPVTTVTTTSASYTTVTTTTSTTCATSVSTSETCTTSIETSETSTTICTTSVETDETTTTTCETSISTSETTSTTCVTSVSTSETTSTTCITSVSTTETCTTSVLTSETTSTTCVTSVSTSETTSTTCETSVSTSETTTCTTTCTTSIETSVTTTCTTTCETSISTSETTTSTCTTSVSTSETCTTTCETSVFTSESTTCTTSTVTHTTSCSTTCETSTSTSVSTTCTSTCTTSVLTSETTTTTCETSVSTSETCTSTCTTSISTSETTTTICETSISTSDTTTTVCETSVSTSITTTCSSTCTTSVFTSETTTTICETSVSTSETCTTTCETSVSTSESTSCTTTTITHTTSCATTCETSTSTSMTTTCTSTCITSISTSETSTTTCSTDTSVTTTCLSSTETSVSSTTTCTSSTDTSVSSTTTCTSSTKTSVSSTTTCSTSVSTSETCSTTCDTSIISSTSTTCRTTTITHVTSTSTTCETSTETSETCTTTCETSTSTSVSTTCTSTCTTSVSSTETCTTTCSSSTKTSISSTTTCTSSTDMSVSSTTTCTSSTKTSVSSTTTCTTSVSTSETCSTICSTSTSTSETCTTTCSTIISVTSTCTTSCSTTTSVTTTCTTTTDEEEETKTIVQTEKTTTTTCSTSESTTTTCSTGSSTSTICSISCSTTCSTSDYTTTLTTTITSGEITTTTAVQTVLVDGCVFDDFDDDALVDWYNNTQRNAGGYVEVADEDGLYNPTSILNVTGILDAGNISSVQTFNDGDEYNVSEVNGTPGFDIRFNFTGVPDSVSVHLNIYVVYEGLLTHDVTIDVWNVTSGAWVSLASDIDAGTDYAWVNNSYAGLYRDLAVGELIQCRIYHSSAGNVNHDISIDYIEMRVDRCPCGQVYSVNMLGGLNVTQIVNFSYNVTIPTGAGCIACVQFSQDSATWVDSGGVAQWELLQDGEHTILLTGLDWAGNFYYRVYMHKNATGVSPTLDYVQVCYNTIEGYGWNILMFPMIAVFILIAIVYMRKRW